MPKYKIVLCGSDGVQRHAEVSAHAVDRIAPILAAKGYTLIEVLSGDEAIHGKVSVPSDDSVGQCTDGQTSHNSTNVIKFSRYPNVSSAMARYYAILEAAWPLIQIFKNIEKEIAKRLGDLFEIAHAATLFHCTYLSIVHSSVPQRFEVLAHYTGIHNDVTDPNGVGLGFSGGQKSLQSAMGRISEAKRTIYAAAKAIGVDPLYESELVDEYGVNPELPACHTIKEIYGIVHTGCGGDNTLAALNDEINECKVYLNSTRSEAASGDEDFSEGECIDDLDGRFETLRDRLHEYFGSRQLALVMWIKTTQEKIWVNRAVADSLKEFDSNPHKEQLLQFIEERYAGFLKSLHDYCECTDTTVHGPGTILYSGCAWNSNVHSVAKTLLRCQHELTMRVRERGSDVKYQMRCQIHAESFSVLLYSDGKSRLTQVYLYTDDIGPTRSSDLYTAIMSTFDRSYGPGSAKLVPSSVPISRWSGTNGGSITLCNADNHVIIDYNGP